MFSVYVFDKKFTVRPVNKGPGIILLLYRGCPFSKNCHSSVGSTKFNFDKEVKCIVSFIRSVL